MSDDGNLSGIDVATFDETLDLESSGGKEPQLNGIDYLKIHPLNEQDNVLNQTIGIEKLKGPRVVVFLNKLVYVYAPLNKEILFAFELPNPEHLIAYSVDGDSAAVLTNHANIIFLSFRKLAKIGETSMKPFFEQLPLLGKIIFKKYKNYIFYSFDRQNIFECEITNNFQVIHHRNIYSACTSVIIDFFSSGSFLLVWIRSSDPLEAVRVDICRREYSIEYELFKKYTILGFHSGDSHVIKMIKDDAFLVVTSRFATFIYIYPNMEQVDMIPVARPFKFRKNEKETTHFINSTVEKLDRYGFMYRILLYFSTGACSSGIINLYALYNPTNKNVKSERASGGLKKILKWQLLNPLSHWEGEVPINFMQRVNKSNFIVFNKADGVFCVEVKSNKENDFNFESWKVKIDGFNFENKLYHDTGLLNSVGDLNHTVVSCGSSNKHDNGFIELYQRRFPHLPLSLEVSLPHKNVVDIWLNNREGNITYVHSEEIFEMNLHKDEKRSSPKRKGSLQPENFISERGNIVTILTLTDTNEILVCSGPVLSLDNPAWDLSLQLYQTGRYLISRYNIETGVTERFYEGKVGGGLTGISAALVQESNVFLLVQNQDSTILLYENNKILASRAWDGPSIASMHLSVLKQTGIFSVTLLTVTGEILCLCSNLARVRLFIQNEFATALKPVITPNLFFCTLFYDSHSIYAINHNDSSYGVLLQVENSLNNVRLFENTDKTLSIVTHDENSKVRVYKTDISKLNEDPKFLPKVITFDSRVPIAICNLQFKKWLGLLLIHNKEKRGYELVLFDYITRKELAIQNVPGQLGSKYMLQEISNHNLGSFTKTLFAGWFVLYIGSENPCFKVVNVVKQNLIKNVHTVRINCLVSSLIITVARNGLNKVILTFFGDGVKEFLLEITQEGSKLSEVSSLSQEQSKLPYVSSAFSVEQKLRIFNSYPSRLLPRVERSFNGTPSYLTKVVVSTQNSPLLQKPLVRLLSVSNGSSSSIYSACIDSNNVLHIKKNVECRPDCGYFGTGPSVSIPLYFKVNKIIAIDNKYRETIYGMKFDEKASQSSMPLFLIVGSNCSLYYIERTAPERYQPSGLLTQWTFVRLGSRYEKKENVDKQEYKMLISDYK
ncbi:hypothetical protein KAFR_0E00610 [Kazachstania africana CBS 2517]|uniref:Uncharacterized protein n=1 Tax=Kazachstania africana (strain ATCC 22294 / BCRC 22015 / CBS 2517 / CECT 1963 / NBRC 1671 / NRRL Y-8276) TaxID=1071382 RepID=H2AV15_KAZAF|nr:hypothetical protein KAFR_0E00610 [Kazachstania africana CBS 2517]CCF58215.1 hypothetical protein KAFR_0E00610 [Kazachstania africana CBS 2517]